MTSPRNVPLRMGTQQIQGLGDGTDAKDAVNKGQLDAAIGGITATVSSVAFSGGTTGLTVSGSPITTSGTITLAGTLAIANGGTGLTTLTSNNVILGNGTSAVQFVAPGTSGNILKSNGTTWTSAAPVPEWTFVKKTSDQTVSLSATHVDDTELQFAMSANKIYIIRTGLSLEFTSGSYSWGIQGPSSPTRVRASNVSAYGTVVTAGGTTGTIVSLSPILIENGANAGNFKITFAQSSGAAGSVTMEKGSYLEYRELS